MSSIANKVAVRWLQHPSFPAGQGQNALWTSELAPIKIFTVYSGPAFEYKGYTWLDVEESIVSFAI